MHAVNEERTTACSIDAELAARALVAGTSTAVAKTRNGEAEMLRILKGTRDSARVPGSDAPIDRQAPRPRVLLALLGCSGQL